MDDRDVWMWKVKAKGGRKEDTGGLIVLTTASIWSRTLCRCLYLLFLCFTVEPVLLHNNRHDTFYAVRPVYAVQPEMRKIELDI